MSGNNQQTKRSQPYYFWLDFLRGTAILLVLFHHLSAIPLYSVSPSSFLFVLQQIGWIGVDIFFVISGFLIGGIIFRLNHFGENTFPLKFYIRRAFRIFPVYFFVFILILLSPRSDTVDFAYFVPSFLFVQNYFPDLPHVFWGHTWSLSIEEHFYLVFPVLVGILAKHKKITFFPLVTVFIFIFCLSFRIGYVWGSDPNTFDYIFFTHTRLEGVLGGCLIAYWRIHHPNILERMFTERKIVFLGIFILLLPALSFPVHNSSIMKTIGLTMNALAFMGIIGVASQGAPGKLTRFFCWPIARIGIVSYSLYLVHPVIFQIDFIRPITVPAHQFLRVWLVPAIGDTLSPVIGYFFIAIGLAVVLYYGIERPGMALRDKLLP